MLQGVTVTNMPYRTGPLGPSVTRILQWLFAVEDVREGFKSDRFVPFQIYNWVDDSPEHAELVYRELRALSGETRMVADLFARRYQVGRYRPPGQPATRTRLCAVCNVEYTPRRSDSLTCSDRCRKQRSRTSKNY
jgi:hypothetical protein